jgi:hypothetical protein
MFAEIADELVSEGDAVRELRTRAPGAGGILEIIVRHVVEGASFVTVTIAGKDLVRVAKRLVRHASDRTPSGEGFSVDLKGPDGEETVAIPAGMPQAEADVLVLQALDRVKRPDPT